MSETPTDGTYGEREAVRMPLWLAIVGSQAFALGIALLTDVYWKDALVMMLGSLGPALFGTEIARQRAWSPTSVIYATQAAREDERAKNPTASITLVAHPVGQDQPLPPPVLVPEFQPGADTGPPAR